MTHITSTHTDMIFRTCCTEQLCPLTDTTIKPSTLMGAFEKLEKRISSSSCPAVCLPVRMGTTQLPFVKCGTRGFLFRKSVANIQVSLKADKNNEHFTLRPIYIYDISLSHSQNGIKFVQKIKTCVLCSIIYFFF